MYIVNYSTGSYDDYSVVPVFVTEDFDLASKWVMKFNSRLKYWVDVLKPYVGEYGVLDEKYYDNVFLRNRYWDIKETNEAWFCDIKKR